MANSYYDNQEAKVNISIELEKKGWKIFGFREDQSDSMTDYWNPAHWNGLATKNGYVLVIDNSNTYYSGYEIKDYKYNKSAYSANDRIKKLIAMMNDPASTENEKASCATLIEKEEEKAGVKPSYTVKEMYPVFNFGNPKKCTWHIEKDNQIIAKGTGVFATNTYDWEDKTKTSAEQKEAKLNAFINKIETALKQDGALESEVIKVPKTFIKPVEKTDKTINVNDVLSFKYHGHYWVVTNIYQNNQNETCISYELLGSEKRGYQRLSGTTLTGKRYYQRLARLEKEMSEGTTKVYTLEEVVEWESKTVYKKTAKKQKANFDVEAIAGDVQEVTEEVNTETVNNNANNENQDITVSFNKEKNGIEIKFTNKPSQNVISNLKENGFRWFQPLGFWCAKQTPERLKFAQSLCNSVAQEQPTEEQQTAPEAYNSAPEVNPDELMVEILADSLTDYILVFSKPQTDPEKEAANKHILSYMVSREVEPTEGMLAYMQNEYPFLYSIVTHKNNITDESKDPYAFNVDTAYAYHDIHFKAWEMEIPTLEEYLTVFQIPFYIAGEKFICKGITTEHVKMIEEINIANGAIIFYDDKYNNNPYNTETITEPDNVVYYNFGSVDQEEEKETEEVNTFNDDIFSKFEKVEVTTESKIATIDLDFCKSQEGFYKEAITVLKNALESFKVLKNAYIDTYDDIRHMEERINNVKNSFISKTCYYFIEKYSITIDSSKIQKKYDHTVTYDNIIDEIFLQMGGFNFNEKASKEIKDKLKKEFSYREATTKGSKLLLDKFLYIDDSWKKYGDEKIHYNSTSKLEQLFKALQHYENGSTTLNEQMQVLYRQLANGKNEAVFGSHELNSGKVKTIKVFKNGKVEIEFTSSQLSMNFTKEYCTNVA